MGLYNTKGLFDELLCRGVYIRGAYTQGNNKIIKISNFSLAISAYVK